jgi:hypothetical protein
MNPFNFPNFEFLLFYLCLSVVIIIAMVLNQGCQLAEMPMRGKGSSHEVRVALQDLAEMSQLRQG